MWSITPVKFNGIYYDERQRQNKATNEMSRGRGHHPGQLVLQLRSSLPLHLNKYPAVCFIRLVLWTCLRLERRKAVKFLLLCVNKPDFKSLLSSSYRQSITRRLFLKRIIVSCVWFQCRFSSNSFQNSSADGKWRQSWSVDSFFDEQSL